MASADAEEFMQFCTTAVEIISLKVLQSSFISIKTVESIPPVKIQHKAEEMRREFRK